MKKLINNSIFFLALSLFIFHSCDDVEIVQLNSDANTSLTLSHIISYEFESNFFLNTGVGLALLTDNKIGDRNLGSSLQFESRFGFGYRTDNTNSSVNIFHYSNAGTANDNSGVNILMLNLSHLF